MADPDWESFETVTVGNQFEDFAVDQCFDHHWGRTITAGDNVIFSTATCNWNPMHLNAEYARDHGHPDVVVNPMLVLCTVVGLSVEDLSEAGGLFLGMEDVKFFRPVHPGDTLTASSTVVSARESTSNPATGIVTWRTEGRNQNDDIVVRYERSNLIVKRVAP